MKKEEIISHLNIIFDNIGLDEITDTTKNFYSDLGLDDLDVIDIVTRCEYEFGISISDETLDTIQTIDELISTIESLN